MFEQSLKLPITNEYDVSVCGGGIAGISAALASARQGKKTILFEKQYMLGGLATAGLVTIYLPLCDGFGKQVSFGIAEELLRLSIKYGAEDRYPDNWFKEGLPRGKNDKRFEVQYNPQIFAILAEKLLIENGVKIMYGTFVSSVSMDGDKIHYVITENKSGRCAYKIQSVVDATGDCDVAKLSNAPTKTFKQGNVLANWFYSTGKKGYELNMLGYADIPEEEKKTRAIAKDNDKKRFEGLSEEERSEFTVLSHQAVLDKFEKEKEKDSSYWPVTIATIPQIRMTRKLVGEYTLSHIEEHTEFADSIGMVSNWKERGPIYEVPFRTLYNNSVKNLITAGRSVSTNETLWDVLRVIPCCAVTGQAAGTAAALTGDFSTLDIKKLQKELQKAGVILHESEL